MTICKYLDRIVQKYPDRPAIVFEGKRWSYTDYAEAVDRFANAFSSVGVGHGDRVAVFNTNCPEHLFTPFAAAKLGAVYSPMNCRLKGGELVHVLTDCDPSIVLVGKRYSEQVGEITAAIENVKHTLVIDAPPGEPNSLHDFLLEAGGDASPPPEVPDEATALLLYTSGTTGAAKGVMHSHANIIRRIEGRQTVFDDDSVEKTGLLAVPVFHVTGIQVIIKTVASGGTLAIMPQFRVEDFFQIIETEKVMMAVVVPTMLAQIVEYPDMDRFDLSSLQILVYGGSSISPDLIREAMGKLPCMFSQGYGLTEVGVTWLPPTDHSLDPPPGRRDPLESVGRAVPGLEIAIVDKEGNHLPTGETGEIIVRGGDVMDGYWRREDETARAVRDGWFYTGDSGYLDEEGFLFMAGRKKDIIIRGGENIAPIEVENVLMSHPAVGDAGVFGILDPKWGEIVAAAVVLRRSAEATADELTEFCRERMASYKKPERIFFVQQLPRNASGKLLAKELRKTYADS
jgi:acyl-CoA synthetase (AMP-forming)/AMP-acid ligase II